VKQLARITALAALVVFASAACNSAARANVGTAPAAQSPALGGCPIFPIDNAWNAPVDALPVDPNSAAYIANINTNKTTLHPDFSSVAGGNYGIPFNIVPQGQAKVPIAFGYADESDAGPYPIPANPKIEDGSDQHILVVEQGTCKLYETWDSSQNDDGTWRAGSGAIFDLRSNALRPDTWTSADAAGLPILPGLARYDEVAAGAIDHALRFTVHCTADAYIWPARHKAVPGYCPSTPTAGLPPPMGQRFRLKASFDISHFGPQTQVILKALKKYGMIVADNGSSWYISGAPDAGWDDDDLVGGLRGVHGTDFEAVDTSSLRVSPNSGQANVERKGVTPGAARQGQQASFTIQFAGANGAASLSDPLPAGMSLVSGPITAPASVPAATYDAQARTISWSGAPPNTVLVSISYTVRATRRTPRG
jgi:hypothetical protein